MAHEKDQDQFAVNHRAQWEKDVAEKQRLAKMVDAKDTFGTQIQTRRAEEFEALRVRTPHGLLQSNVQMAAKGPACFAGCSRQLCLPCASAASPHVHAAWLASQSEPCAQGLVHIFGCLRLISSTLHGKQRPQQRVLCLQREREARIAAKKQQLREDRDLRRKQEYTRRCLLQLEVKRLKVNPWLLCTLRRLRGNTLQPKCRPHCSRIMPCCLVHPGILTQHGSALHVLALVAIQGLRAVICSPGQQVEQLNVHHCR